MREENGMIGRMKLWLLVPVLLVVAACSTIWKRPEVSLVDVRVLGGNIVQQNLRLSVKVLNDNPFDMTLEGLDVDLVVGGSPLAHGHLVQPGTVFAHTTKIFEIDAGVQLLRVLQYLPRWIQADGMVHYQLRGHGRIRGYGDVEFDHPGKLDPARLH